MPEPQQTQKQSGRAPCPKHPSGHSWKAVAVLEDRVQQRCRCCEQARTVPLPLSLQERERQARQGR